MSIHTQFLDFVRAVSLITDPTQSGRVLLRDADTQRFILLLDEPFLKSFNFKDHYEDQFSSLQGRKFHDLSKDQQNEVIKRTKTALSNLREAAAHWGNQHRLELLASASPSSVRGLLEKNAHERVVLSRLNNELDESEELAAEVASAKADKAEQIESLRKKYKFCAAIAENPSLRAYDSVCTKMMRQGSKALSYIRVPAFVKRVVTTERVMLLGAFALGAVSFVAKNYFFPK